MPRDDDFEDRPKRRGPRDDDDFEDRPRRRRPEDDDRDYAPPRKKSSGGLFLILGIVAFAILLVCGGGIGLLFFATSKVRDAADRMSTTNDGKQIVLACMNYESMTSGYPTNSYSPDGRPLLSWRVHILPFLEQDALYRQFKLDEPWDGPSNRRLLDQMPAIYATKAEQKSGKIPNKTYYRGFSNPGTGFSRKPGPMIAILDSPLGGRDPRGIRPQNVTDGTSNTILFLEAGEPVEWTKPEDLDASPGKPFPKLGGARPDADNVLVVFMDGSVRMVNKAVPEFVWRGGTTIAGNEVVNFD